jgi:hypothetical protein
MMEKRSNEEWSLSQTLSQIEAVIQISQLGQENE